MPGSTSLKPTREAHRTVNGVTYTKNRHTGAWENRELGISVHACYTGNMCSKVAYYCINVQGKRPATSPHGLTAALETAAQAAMKP